MKYLRLLIFLLMAATAHAQITVSLYLKERFHLLHEPIIATVNVTNLTGRDITLSDTSQYQWFAFRILTDGDRMIQPRNLAYHVPSLEVKSGETVKRTVNLNQLYELGEPGRFRIQASIYYDGLDKFFISKPEQIEVSEGHLIWRQIAGVPSGLPGAGQARIFSLLSHQVGEHNTLYVRVEGQEDGMIYCTTAIGHLLDNVAPQAEFDAGNNLYVLHLSGTRAYTLTKFSPNGDYAGQTGYTAPKTRPTMRKTPEGALEIVGGRRDAPIALNPAPVPVPKISDRPPGFPAAN